MIDWDDVRYFLAIARSGSVRAAAEILGVNHSTALRRIALLEERLATQIFEKFPSGYRLTDAGEEILKYAEEMEGSLNRLQTRISGRDQQVRGLLKVTMSPTIATHLLMPEFAAFSNLHPGIELEVLSGDEPVNLTNRQADVAVRVVYDRFNLPPNLHGTIGPELHGSAYLARDLLKSWSEQKLSDVRWIIKKRDGLPDWVRDTATIPAAELPFTVTDAAAQIAAARLGLGMTMLPCFVGDAEQSLVRVPGCPTRLHGTLWLLTQGETRKTKRVRLFIEFLSKRLAVHQPLLAGLEPAKQ